MTFFTIQLSFEYHLKVEKDLCNNGFRIVWISLLTSHLDVKLVQFNITHHHIGCLTIVLLRRPYD